VDICPPYSSRRGEEKVFEVKLEKSDRARAFRQKTKRRRHFQANRDPTRTLCELNTAPKRKPAKTEHSDQICEDAITISSLILHDAL
jgi:hypothetical protein